ncbi:TIGR02677 family protein [Burkholderia ambifaria]|uniref:TIGR02677 family protein n=1 Tax=Burkholderia ambifaria TaxID=152480 RepID=UPI00158EBAF6|nr:TIGR02677 family protein [Burkholderia ambifaria]
MREEDALLFRHVSADRGVLYRQILDVFASARRQFRLQLRPDDVLAEGAWNSHPPSPEDLNQALSQLTSWGNLETQADMSRASSLSMFYRARLLYRLSKGGESVEASLDVFQQGMKRKAELQTVALDDIATSLQALVLLAKVSEPDVAKVHELLRDLMQRFEDLAENARGFMASVARGIELQHAETSAVIRYKKNFIDYIERFIGDFVRRSDSISRAVTELEPTMSSLLWQVAQREAFDAAPTEEGRAEVSPLRWKSWRDRWKGLRGWFLQTGNEPPQAELLRGRARSAIPQLLGAISTLNDRRSGRSDRSADFRTLAHWFASCEDDGQAHRLARAAFALNSARHFSLNPSSDDSVNASTPWASAPPLTIHPRLREYGEAIPRAPLGRIRDRSEDRARLQAYVTEETRQVEAARARLATKEPFRLSEVSTWGQQEFDLFLAILGDALANQRSENAVVECQTSDGLLRIRMEPLDESTRAVIDTPDGAFAGRDHILTIISADDTA